MNNGSKISDEQFLSVLRENAGLYAKTARAIEEQFNITYSRQAVRKRAAQFVEELEDIEEQNLDIAEEGLYTLMKSGNEAIKLGSIKLYLSTKGKKRGYVERHELTGKDGKAMQIEQITGMEVK